MNLVKRCNVLRLLGGLTLVLLCSAGSAFIFRTHRGTHCYSYKMDKPVAPSRRSTRRQRAQQEDKEEIGEFTIHPQGMDNSDELVVERHTLLQDWIHHDRASFHHFSPKEAAAIREALLIWYKANRRKLPWRGDPPPYDGSTAGIAVKRSKKTKYSINPPQKSQPEVKDETQSSITNFFSTTSTTRTTKRSSPLSSALSSVCQGSKRQVAMEEEEKDNGRIEDITSLPGPQNQPIPVSPYGVWVSEIMLQQTRVEAVIPYWIKWMKSFPTVHDLASASEEEVNAHWAGLGFYRRARLLHRGAQHVVETLNGQLPEMVDDLKQISGIGPYTACAIASIAFNECVPVVDGNVCRVLSRLRGIANHIKSPALKDKLGWDLARQLVEAGDGKQSGLVNQALMELGATYCAPSGTGVDPKDPLRPFYWSTQLGRAYAASRADYVSTGTNATANVNGRRKGAPIVKKQNSTNEGSAKEFCELCSRDGVRSVLAEWQVALSDDAAASGEDPDMVAAQYGHATFPLNPPKLRKREEDLAVAVLRREDCWLLVKRPKQGLLAGQWEFPSVCLQTRGESTSAANSTKPPSAQRRRQALTQLLKELFSCNDDGIEDRDLGGHPDYYARRESLFEEPIEHIFSHVKHIMWVEACCLGKGSKPDLMEWETAENSRQVRWMREEDMKEVGITSGVQKIIKAVQGEQRVEGNRNIASAGRKREKK